MNGIEDMKPEQEKIKERNMNKLDRTLFRLMKMDRSALHERARSGAKGERFVAKVLLVIDNLPASEQEDGGPGSGNWGHKGRPGQVGGSGKGGARSIAEDAATFCIPRAGRTGSMG